MNRNIEILAPAGSLESLKAAVAAGADAVYMGGQKFGARAYAKNPEEDQLLWAIDYAHIHGCKLYLTVNTLLKDNELDELYAYLLPYYLHGLDAVIVQDVGVLSYIRFHFPDLPIHASTQMTITGTQGASLMKKQGVERIVPARELSLKEIKEIKENTGLEMECFVHGALCYCYSGQCLFSSLIGGRSSNRGQCAQPCRLEFEADNSKATTVLSLKDLSTVEMIPLLIESGIDSFKIEGRMKQPDYVYTVVQIYKKYVDLYLNNPQGSYIVSPEDKERLLAAYQRRGYTDGYYKRHNGKEMISFSRPRTQPQEQDYIQDYKIQEKINGKLILLSGIHAKLNLSFGDVSITCEGAVPQEALKQPLTRERIETQMRKTGTTEFQFEQLDIELTGDLFLPMQSLNELRREALEKLSEEFLLTYKRGMENVGLVDSCQTFRKSELHMELPLIATYVTTEEQLRAVHDREQVEVIYIDEEIGLFPTENVQKLLDSIRLSKKKIVLSMPHIFRKNATQMWEECYHQMETLYDGILIRNYDSMEWLREHNYKKEIITDHNLYVFNQYAKYFFRQNGMGRFTAPLELNSKELSRLMITDESLVVYGYMPMMITANCIEKTMGNCSHKEKVHLLKDRYRKEFVVKNNCRYCYNIIYNSAPLMLLKHQKEIAQLSPKELRLDFTTETAKQTKSILNLYVDAFLYDKEVQMPDSQFTKGHFKRGVK